MSMEAKRKRRGHGCERAEHQELEEGLEGEMKLAITSKPCRISAAGEQQKDREAPVCSERKAHHSLLSMGSNPLGSS